MKVGDADEFMNRLKISWSLSIITHLTRKKTVSTTSPKTSFGMENLFTSWKKLSPGSTGKNLPSHHLTAPSVPLQPCGKRTAKVRMALVLHQQYKSYGTAKN